MDAIFSAWSTWRSSCLISVRSWKITIAPCRTPSPSTSGAQEVPIGARSPPSPPITPSPPPDPAPGARARARAGRGAEDPLGRGVREVDRAHEIHHHERAVHVLDDVLVDAAEGVGLARGRRRAVAADLLERREGEHLLLLPPPPH